ncbi:hypothetical protein GCM10010402_35180 [Actinomadura luteofluorescens]
MEGLQLAGRLTAAPGEVARRDVAPVEGPRRRVAHVVPGADQAVRLRAPQADADGLLGGEPLQNACKFPSAPGGASNAAGLSRVPKERSREQSR